MINARHCLSIAAAAGLMLLPHSATAQTTLQASQPSGLDPFLKVAQLGAWIATIVFGLVALWRTLNEVRENRKLRSEELRWKKANLARDVVLALKGDPKVRDALKMLDWTGREYDVREGVRKTVTWEEMEEALRPHDASSSFSTTEVHIRDCFDNLFDAIEQIEHFLRIELIEFEDVRYPLGYYIKKLKEHESAVARFIEFYEYDHAAAFIARF